MSEEKRRHPDVPNIKEILDYNPETGIFTWRVDRNYRTKKGDIAGTIVKNNGENLYRRIRAGSQQVMAHRLAFYYMTGEWPSFEIDHINGDGLDNKWSNLREATHQQNMRNTRLNKHNKYGIPGVGWKASESRWYADISANGKTCHVAYTPDFFEACCARKSAENRFGFHPNHGRTTP